MTKSDITPSTFSNPRVRLFRHRGWFVNNTFRRDLGDAMASLAASLAIFSLVVGFGGAAIDESPHPADAGSLLGGGVFLSLITLIVGFVFVAIAGPPLALAVELAVSRTRRGWIRYTAHFVVGVVAGGTIFSLLSPGPIANGPPTSLLLGTACGTSAALGVFVTRAFHRRRDRQLLFRATRQPTA